MGPLHKENVDKIEMIQRRAARYDLNRFNNTSSVTNMLNDLEQRRKVQRLTNLYNTLNGLVVLDSYET